MKIALCFSGQPRNISDCYESIKNNLIIPNNITDIFMHFWWREEWGKGESFTSRNSGHYRSPISFPQNVENILEIYHPIKFEFEDDRKYDDYIQKEFYDDASFNRGLPYDRIYGSLLSRYKCNELKNLYEKENKFEYDVVIALRSDLYFRKLIIIDNLDLNYVHLLAISWNPGGVGKDFVNDIFTVGNKKNMDIFCNAVNNMKEHDIKHYDFPGTNGLLAYQLTENNVEWKTSFKHMEDAVIYRDK